MNKGKEIETKKIFDTELRWHQYGVTGNLNRKIKSCFAPSSVYLIVLFHFWQCILHVFQTLSIWKIYTKREIELLEWQFTRRHNLWTKSTHFPQMHLGSISLTVLPPFSFLDAITQNLLFSMAPCRSSILCLAHFHNCCRYELRGPRRVVCGGEWKRVYSFCPNCLCLTVPLYPQSLQVLQSLLDVEKPCILSYIKKVYLRKYVFKTLLSAL